MGLDPVTAIANAIASFNNLLAEVVKKASPETIDKEVELNVKHRERLMQIMDLVVEKTLHLKAA